METVDLLYGGFEPGLDAEGEASVEYCAVKATELGYGGLGREVGRRERSAVASVERGREAHLADSGDGSFISHVSLEEADGLEVVKGELLARVGKVEVGEEDLSAVGDEKLDCGSAQHQQIAIWKLFLLAHLQRVQSLDLSQLWGVCWLAVFSLLGK